MSWWGAKKRPVEPFFLLFFLFKTAIRRTRQTLDEFQHVAINDQSSRWQQSNKRGSWTLPLNTAKKTQKTKCYVLQRAEDERHSLCGNASGLKMFSYLKEVLELECWNSQGGSLTSDSDLIVALEKHHQHASITRSQTPVCSLIFRLKGQVSAERTIR